MQKYGFVQADLLVYTIILYVCMFTNVLFSSHSFSLTKQYWLIGFLKGKIHIFWLHMPLPDIILDRWETKKLFKRTLIKAIPRMAEWNHFLLGKTLNIFRHPASLSCFLSICWEMWIRGILFIYLFTKRHHSRWCVLSFTPYANIFIILIREI